MRFRMNRNKKEKVLRVPCQDRVTIYFCGETIPCFPHIESCLLSAGDKINYIAGNIGGTSLESICEAGDRTSEV